MTVGLQFWTVLWSWWCPRRFLLCVTIATRAFFFSIVHNFWVVLYWTSSATVVVVVLGGRKSQKSKWLSVLLCDFYGGSALRNPHSASGCDFNCNEAAAAAESWSSKARFPLLSQWAMLEKERDSFFSLFSSVALEASLLLARLCAALRWITCCGRLIGFSAGIAWPLIAT